MTVVTSAIGSGENNTSKIRLDKNKLIVFMGGMNAMPMAYAIELKKLGYDVIYFVDASVGNALCRPENFYPDIDFPYPSWVIELILPSQIILSVFPRLFSLLYKLRIRMATGKKVGCFILNGYFVSLAPYLEKRSSKVGLSHGSDLDVWGNIDLANTLSHSFCKRSVFKYLPNLISKPLIKNIIKTQYFGYSQSHSVVYFPPKFNVSGDKVIKKLEKQGVRYVSRYDISFEMLKGQSRKFKPPSKIIDMFSVVRFLFKTFPDGNEEYNKGNDILIEGIALYYLINPNIRVHFVEKGEDVQLAKVLCNKYGIDDVVVWHKEMPFQDLLMLYQNADICFDQVGSHWIGAGVYALWMGRPLIANAESAVLAGVWPDSNPICSANTPEKVCEWLVRLESIDFRRNVSKNSKIFVDTYMGSHTALSSIFEL